MARGGLLLLAAINGVGTALALGVAAGRGRVNTSATDLALTAKWSEDDYQRVASLRSDEAMKAYIRHFLQTKGYSVRDEGFLSGFVPHYSGTIAVQSFSQLAKELRDAEWITREATVAPETQIASKENEVVLIAGWRSPGRLDGTADAASNASVVVQAMPTETAKQGVQETGAQKAEGTGKAAAEALTKTVAMEIKSPSTEYDKKLATYLRSFDWIDMATDNASSASVVVQGAQTANPKQDAQEAGPEKAEGAGNASAEALTKTAAIEREGQSKEYEKKLATYIRSFDWIDRASDTTSNAGAVVQAMPAETAKQGSQETRTPKAEGNGKAAAEALTKTAAMERKGQSKEYEKKLATYLRSSDWIDRATDNASSASVVVQGTQTANTTKGAQEAGPEKAEGAGNASAEALTKTAAIEREGQSQEYKKKFDAHSRRFDWIGGRVERGNNASAVVRTKQVVNMTATSDGAVADKHVFADGHAALQAERKSAAKPAQQTSITKPDQKIAEEEAAKHIVRINHMEADAHELSSEKLVDDSINSTANAADEASVGSAQRQAKDKAQAKPAPTTMQNVSHMAARKTTVKEAVTEEKAARPRARPAAKRLNAAAIKVQVPAGARKMAARQPTTLAAKPRIVMRRAQAARPSALRGSVKQWEAAVDAIFSSTSS